MLIQGLPQPPGYPTNAEKKHRVINVLMYLPNLFGKL
jgi:hypothetical protein